MAKLVAEEGALKELVLPFDEGDQWVIGRDPDACQLLVEDLAASRKHAACRKTAKGILIENLSHTNPLLVNDEPLAEPRLLQHGDTVKIGDTVFRFYTETDNQLYDETNQTTETNISANNTPPFPTIGTPTATLEEPPKNNHRHDTIFEEESAQKIELAQVNFDLMETGRWLLKVVSGPNNGAEFSMQSDASYILGTDPNSCDIVFYDNSVSRQHAKITISQEDKITIEDLRSRNGTRMDGELITASKPLPFNTLVTVGTTSFVVYDREGEMQTIISPLLPSIVKVLQKEEQTASAATASGATAGGGAATAESKSATTKQAPSHTVGALLLTGILVGLFAIVGVAVQTLFFQEPVVIEQAINTDAVLTKAMEPYPGVKFSFNKGSSRLLLVGHVLTSVDKNQLLYDLRNIKFIKDIDDSGVVIDEFVWNEANQVLSKTPQWRGITVHSPEPGRFVVSGYLRSRDQAAGVWEYLTRNFPYIDRLENKVVVEEDILQKVTTALHNYGLGQVTPQMSEGELILSGNIPPDKGASLDEAIKEFRDINGVRSIRNLAAVQSRSESVINITSNYMVSGVSRVDGGHLNVVINGRILAEGDTLDGMKITAIQPNAVYLEKEGLRYRIDISR